MENILKRTGSLAIVAGVSAMIILTAANGSRMPNAENPDAEHSQMYEWGAVQKSYSEERKDGSETAVIRGRSAEITETELEKAMDFYKLSGMSEEESEKAAVLHLEKREALYQEAIANGFTVTDREVENYLRELKAVLYESDNKDEVFAVIEGFGSEEEYWDYEFTVYQKDLPIQKYTEDLQKKLSAQKGRAISQEEWTAYYEQLKNTLVEQQRYRKISDISERENPGE